MANVIGVCEKAIEHYGELHQKVKAMEELAELNVELAREINDEHASRESTIDEIADVYIMIQQLSLMYGEGHVLKRVYEKADRLLEKINLEIKMLK